MDAVERQRCPLCGVLAARAEGWVVVDGVLYESCVACQAKVLLGLRPGRIVHP